jgi:ABC-2 type transport system ATP-binding protein
VIAVNLLDEAERCDAVVLLHTGRVLGEGRPEALSAAMRGRTWRVSAASRKPRVLQAELRHAPGVLDAVVQAGHVRVVSHAAEPLDPAALLPWTAELEVEPVAPRFEDRFIAELRGEADAPRADDLAVAPRPGAGAA